MTDYTPDTSGELWWCNSHQRRATHLWRGERHCDPNLGGILLPCRAVNLTGWVEFDDDREAERQIAEQHWERD